ncbi:class I SAM-dependent methyltransferase [Actinopolymorpha sp. B9G3]|uniref:class I SAM-dependent methyltransferase n=1 Tax=Actinopolymorpha sp. B9G3 TaxID=3158970 RepID=UPI0032D97690
MDSGLPQEMFQYYDKGGEAGRLSGGAGELERLRTQDLILRHLPPPPLLVLDVGGAAGVHALWLAKRDYDVHLIDPVPGHVEQARAASDAQPSHRLGSATTGDARELWHADTSVDAVLILGPLYHLTERADRMRALEEAYRVLRPGGVVFAAAISRFASMMSGLAIPDLLDDPDFVEIIRQDLRDGQHRNPTEKRYFTTSFFHHPDELRAEMVAAGFADTKIAAVEGPAMWTGSFDADWADAGKRALILEFLRTTEEEPTIIGSGSHFLGIAHR